MEADGILIRESHLRSLVKAISWRIWGTIISVIVSFMITHELDVALAIGAIEFFSKILLFYTHERLWDFVPWGMHAKALNSYELKRYIQRTTNPSDSC